MWLTRASPKENWPAPAAGVGVHRLRRPISRGDRGPPGHRRDRHGGPRLFPHYSEAIQKITAANQRGRGEVSPAQSAHHRDAPAAAAARSHRCHGPPEEKSLEHRARDDLQNGTAVWRVASTRAEVGAGRRITGGSRPGPAVPCFRTVWRVLVQRATRPSRPWRSEARRRPAACSRIINLPAGRSG